MKKVFCSLLVVLMVLALFVSCSSEKETSLTINFLDEEGEPVVLEDDVDYIYITLSRSFIPTVKGAEPESSGCFEDDDVELHLVGEDVEGLVGKSSITIEGIPEDIYSYLGMQISLDDATLFYYGEYEPESNKDYFTLEKGKTVSIDVVLSDPA